MTEEKIFVYGSLMHNFFNYELYLIGKVIDTKLGYIIGSLFHLENKGYPAFIENGHEKIYGEIITIIKDTDTINALDKLENFDGTINQSNEYNRLPIEVTSCINNKTETLDVYVYNVTAERNQTDKKITVPSGSWRTYMENNNIDKIL
jgi:gamma-glutamylcyclotransferase (GGCT)/AIG2-like uncharacterized protein YtfP